MGGIDLQILGIGRNGHIAFNEPGSPPESRTRAITLSAETIRDNARFFSGRGKVPAQAITMGLGTIMDSREILLLASSVSKAEAVRSALEGPVSPQTPASILQKHPRVTVLLDRGAASTLTNTSFG